MHDSQVMPFAAVLQPSLTARLLVGGSWLLAAWALSFVTLPVAVPTGLAALLCGLQLLRDSAMVRPTLDRFQVDARGALFAGRAGQLQRVTLLDSSRVVPWLVMLALRDADGRRRYLLVWRDAVPASAHHALRVYVRWCRTPATHPDVTERI